ncbi:MAG: hypothetical protein ACREBB_08575 [Nitrosotalea sp.]
MTQVSHKSCIWNRADDIKKHMRLLPATVLLIILSGQIAYGQTYTQDNVPNTDEKTIAFPIIAYTQDHEYEADMTWEPHDILTDKKIIFIFQFYDGKTGAIIPDMDYQFVISQNNKELANIPGTTSQSGDYKYFSFNSTGPVTISLEKIADTDLFVSYNTTVYENPHPSGPVTIVQPTQNISDKERMLFPALEDVFVGVLIVFIIWIAREPILKKLKAMP